jgi:hypothetical protein
MNAAALPRPSVIDFVSQGSPGEMGLAQGIAMKDRLHAARDHMLRKAEAFRLQQPRWMPFRGYRWMAEKKVSSLMGGVLERDFPRMRERLEGIAKGAGLKPQSILLFNAMEPLLASVGGCTACPGACSSVAVRGRRTRTGEPIIARNFDYLPLVQPYYTIRKSHPSGRMRSIEFTTAPLTGAIDGMNEAGLCITYDYAFTTDTPEKFSGPISMLVCEALEQCSTVAEAAEWMAAQPRWGGALLMLADATGDIASLELSSTRSHLRRPAPGEDAISHSNLLTGDHMREIQAPLEAVFTDRAPTPLRGERLHESAERRDKRLAELLARTEVFGEEELATMMGDHGEDGVPGKYTPCVHSDYWNTTASLQFFPASRRMKVAYEPACCARFSEMTVSRSD